MRSVKPQSQIEEEEETATLLYLWRLFQTLINLIPKTQIMILIDGVPFSTHSSSTSQVATPFFLSNNTF